MFNEKELYIKMMNSLADMSDETIDLIYRMVLIEKNKRKENEEDDVQNA